MIVNNIIDTNKLSSGLVSTGIILISLGIIKEVRNENYSNCFKTNASLASTLISVGSALNIYNLFRN